MIGLSREGNALKGWGPGFHPTRTGQKFHPLLSLSDSGQADCPYGTPGHIHLGIGGVLAQSQLVSSYGWPA